MSLAALLQNVVVRLSAVERPVSEADERARVEQELAEAAERLRRVESLYAEARLVTGRVNRDGDQ